MSDYSAPGWLPGGHLQTIYPAKFIEPPAVTLKRERWDTTDNDFIDVDFVEGLPGKPLLVLFRPQLLALTIRQHKVLLV